MSFILHQLKRVLPYKHSTSLWQRYVSEGTGKKERIKIVLNDEDLVEKFVKGSGPGGQAVNKRVNCVDLKHIPTGIRVQCQQSRSLQDNRGIARKLLKEKLDDLFNGDLSKGAQKAAKINKQKARKARRAKKKYGAKEEPATDATAGPSESSV